MTSCTSPRASASGLPISRGDQRGQRLGVRLDEPADLLDHAPAHRRRGGGPGALGVPGDAARLDELGRVGRAGPRRPARSVAGIDGREAPAGRVVAPACRPTNAPTCRAVVAVATCVLVMPAPPGRARRRRGPARPRAIVRAGRSRIERSPPPQDQHLLVAVQPRAARRRGPRRWAGRRRRTGRARARCRSRATAAQVVEQPLAEHRGPLDQPLGLDHLEVAPRAHHVGEVAAPGRVDPRGHAEHVVGHLVDPPAGHDPADLQLLAERDDVRLHAELLVGPRGAGHAAAGLHLVEHEQRVVLVAQRLHRLEELGAHVVVAALALDRLGDEAGDVVRVRGERGPSLRQRALPRPPRPRRRRSGTGSPARRCAASRTSGRARSCAGRCW